MWHYVICACIGGFTINALNAALVYNSRGSITSIFNYGGTRDMLELFALGATVGLLVAHYL